MAVEWVRGEGEASRSKGDGVCPETWNLRGVVGRGFWAGR